MADEKQLEILRQGVEVWNKWREDNPYEVVLAGADLRGINLWNANLAEANLTDANLWGTNFVKADLTAAKLLRSNLTQTNLKEAKLSFANIREAVLCRAGLQGADLVGANLEKSDLMGVDLTGANLMATNLLETDLSYSQVGNTIFGNNNLGAAFGLETIRHYGPSAISTDTVRQSKGKIPIAFLRGCGLSDLEIEQAKLAATGLDPEQVIQITYEIYRIYCDQPIQFYSCFISYNSKDYTFAKRLHDDLQDSSVRCWFAPEDMKIGDPIRPRIDREIRLRDRLLVILSENSVKSEWVGDEVEAALEEESASGRLVLFPVRLDDAVMNTRDDWAAKIKRRRHIGDFTNWNDDGSYHKAFERLLRDLRAQ